MLNVCSDAIRVLFANENIEITENIGTVFNMTDACKFSTFGNIPSFSSNH